MLKAFLLASVSAVAVLGPGAQAAVSFGYDGKIDSYVTPSAGYYTITAIGGHGSFNVLALGIPNASYGSYVSAAIKLAAHETLSILVGGDGAPGAHRYEGGGGGGGGTFVVGPGYAPLLVAGGGGGSGSRVGEPGQGDRSPGSGDGGAAGTKTAYYFGGGGGGGGGFRGDGGSATQTDQSVASGGSSFLNGGAGGVFRNTSRYPGLAGGFGGGGAGGDGLVIANSERLSGGGGGGGGFTGGAGGNGGYQSYGYAGKAGSDFVVPGAINVVRNQGGTGSLIYAAVYISKVTSAVPEPTTWSLMLMGLGFIGHRLRRSRRPAMAPGA